MNRDGKKYRVALAGQPNAGKSSIFNALTGASQHVGNYPGVTVERREGNYKHDATLFHVVDLPGTYSLSSYSPEERVAQDELLEKDADVVVVVVDSTALTRSLVFLAQVMHMGANVVLCLNMSDEARSAGQDIDVDLMVSLLGCQVIQTEGHRRTGIDKLKAAVARASVEESTLKEPVLGPRLSRAIQAISKRLEGVDIKPKHRGWMACRLLVDDAEVRKTICEQGREDGAAVGELAASLREEIELETDEDISVFVTGRYYGFAHGLVTETMRTRPREDARALSDLVDRLLVHKILGLPVFFAVMYGIFWATFSLGEYPMGWIENGFEWLSSTVASAWPETSLPAVRSLVLDGVIAGVGGVVVFLPNIIILFFGLALMEDTGYMARAAFLTDRLMHRFGLHGKSFLPMMTGFGCTVPAIMATRTLENERDRLTTMLVLPLMSCGARLPIWMLLVPAFFAPAFRAPVLGGIYFVGVMAALLMALILRKTALRGDETPFVMELPPYRMPTLRASLSKMAERSWLYLKKAGTVILGISILMWFVTSYPKPGSYEVDARIAAGEEIAEAEAGRERAAEDLATSAAGRLGRLIEPVLKPLGFDWRLGTGMLGAFAAKEVFVAQMGIVHALGEVDENSESLRTILSRRYSPLVGISLILFLLIATPCMATVAVTRKESGSWKWAALQFFGLTAFAYVVSFAVFQIGTLLGF